MAHNDDLLELWRIRTREDGTLMACCLCRLDDALDARELAAPYGPGFFQVVTRDGTVIREFHLAGDPQPEPQVQVALAG